MPQPDSPQPDEFTAESILKPADLRGILRYVPMFRGHTFVLAIDGSVIAHENLPNLLTDIAVLHSLQIHLVIVHGTGQQLRELSEKRALAVSDVYGTGPTDHKTLELAIEAASQATHLLMGGLAQVGMRCVMTNVVRSTEKGVISGTDFLLTGRIDRIDTAFLSKCIQEDALPIISPIAFNRHGQALRLNSDTTAAEVAVALEASKLIYLTRSPGLIVDEQIQKTLSRDALEALLRENAGAVEGPLLSKAQEALNALRGGVARTHILDGTAFGGLLTEIFEKEGVGTLIHANEYEQIRPARKRDIQGIYSLTRQGARSDALRRRTRQSLERDLDNFYVFEIDGSLMACACLTPYPEDGSFELGTVYVHPLYQKRGIGRKMVEYAIHRARTEGGRRLIALSTQNFSFFRYSAEFRPASVEDLPPTRRETFLKEKRGGQILIRDL